MNAELLQATIDVVFSGYMPYLAIPIFLLLVILFADRLIDLIYHALGSQSSGRRSRY